jgi:exo-1,4-beta-D-glucosaminidase
MGLNTVRLEGKLETEEFFEMADQQGILVMAGWCCCDFWEHWGSWKDEDFEIAKPLCATRCTGCGAIPAW